MRVECKTDVGVVRPNNQDACACGLFSSRSAWTAVCDGMGGASGGNVASTIAVGKLREALVSGFREGLDPEGVKALMLDAVAQANTAVYEESLRQPGLRGMGTTAVLMVASNGLLHVAHVGDSRGYLKNEKGLTQITMDHSYVQDLVNLGQLTAEQARIHPQRNIITRVLGVYDEVRSDYSCFDFAPGDLALACSDGLSNYMENGLLLQYVEEYGKNGGELPEKLIRYAVESGGSDNITVAVILNG